MKILVTGGLGYIGSHMVRMLLQRGHAAIVVDTVEHGWTGAIPPTVPVVIGSVGDKAVLDGIFEKETIDAVIHFAGYISVEESVREPLRYIRNNFLSPFALLESMEKHTVNKLIFSSTAGVYGNPSIVPIPESHPKNPTSMYGLSKWCFEEMLGYFDRKKSLRSMSLRYFNAAGASLDGNFGEAHKPESHIIPLAIQTALGKQKEFFLYGTKYPTRDGTCERDYIHLEDLCEAHILALDALMNGHASDALNVGTGNGVTNLELIDQVKKVSGVDFTVTESGPRSGDPYALVADSTKIAKELAWKPHYSDIATIISTAWKWHTTHPNGYEKDLHA